MLIALISVLLVLAVGYAYLREGIFTGFVMMCNALVAGIVAFNFWEPAADYIETLIAGTFLQGYEDAVVLIALYALTLGGLRLLTNNLAPTEMIFPAAV